MSEQGGEGVAAGLPEIEILIIQLLCVMLPLLVAMAITIDHLT